MRLQKTNVFADSVLCMGGVSSNPVKAWKEKIDWFMNSRQYRGLDRIDGELTEFERTNVPGFTTLEILAEIQNVTIDIKCEREPFQGSIIFMSMYNDIVWGEKGNRETCVANSLTVADCAHRTLVVSWARIGKEVL